MNVTACETFTWEVNNETYNESGRFEHVTFNETTQCNDVAYLNLTITEPVTYTTTETACETYTWEVNNETYTTSGTYEVEIPNTETKCNDIQRLVLTINQAKTTEISETSYQQYNWNEENYTTSGDYQRTFTAANGCDSIVTLHLTIVEIDQFTITLDYSNGGTGGDASINASLNATLPNFNLPIYAEHTFLGYYTSAIGGVQIIDANGILIASRDEYSNEYGEWVRLSATTLYAQWASNSHTLYFNSNYTGGNDPNSQEVTPNQAIESLPTMTREGYEFVGWFINQTKITEETIWIYDGDQTATAYYLSLEAHSPTTVECGQEIVLSADGAQSYTWSTTSTSNINAIHEDNTIATTITEPTTITVTGRYFNYTHSISIEADILACPENIPDEANGNDTYSVGKYGNNCWFRENFKGLQYADHTAIPFADGYEHEQSAPAEENIETYGRLYPAASAIGTATSNLNASKRQGICPNGWRLPTSGELTALSLEYTDEELKSSTLWADGGGTCTEARGFNALPAGIYDATNQRYEKMYTYTAFWGTSNTTEHITYGQLSCYCGEFEIRESNISNNKFSVRCVKAINAMATSIPIKVNENGTTTLTGYVNGGDYAIEEVGFEINGVIIPVSNQNGFISHTTSENVETCRTYVKITGIDTIIYGKNMTIE